MTDATAVPADDHAAEDLLPEQMRVRRDKRERLIAAGVEPYALGYPRTHTLAEVRSSWPELEAGVETGEQVGVTGRVIFIRNTGKLCFATLREGDGTELQAMLSLDRVGEERLADWKSDVDLGDHVGATGEVISSRRGELSVLASSWAMTGKALRPLPVAHKPLSEESRVRQRYVDLVVRPEARTMARLRPARGAVPAPQLRGPGVRRGRDPDAADPAGRSDGAPLRHPRQRLRPRRLPADRTGAVPQALRGGGIDRVFEINRNFRNEGADSTHSPEFAMLEFYAAYEDYESMAAITRALVQEAAVATFGSTTVTHVDGSQVDLGGEWARVSMFPSVSAAVGEEITPTTPVERLRELAAAAEIDHDPHAIHGKLVEELFEHHVVGTFSGPTFVVDFPVDTSPLVRQHRSLPGVVEKFDLYVAGFELGTGYSELVDPVVQRQRFEEQARLAAGGDDEAMPLDEDFLRAMEYGMPPMGGVGVGIDRLLMALTGVTSIRETILFPLVKPEA